MTLALSATAQSNRTVSGDSVRVSLITCYPGQEIYELYGHTELRVVTAESDIVYNYGTFDFRTPNFMYRFVKGETDYMVMGYPSMYLYVGYDNRKIVEQVLNLTPEEARKVQRALEVNALPENRTYRYNYVLDNCSTRPRDIIEAAISTSICYHDDDVSTTFRTMMHHYNANYAWQQLGIDLALGSGLDYPIGLHEQMFAPITLMQAFGNATVERHGKQEPLVAQTITLSPGSDEGYILPPTPWYAQPLTIAIALLLSGIALSLCDVRRLKVCRIADSALFTIYSLAGSLVAFLVFVSTHEATSPNYNLLWIHPLHIIPAVLVWIKSAEKVVYCYHFLNFAELLLTMLLWWALPQCANVAFFPLMALPAVRSLSYLVIRHKCNNEKTPRSKCESSHLW